MVKSLTVKSWAFLFTLAEQKQTTIMAYELIKEDLTDKVPFRIYKHNLTGSQIRTHLVLNDEENKQRWWGFTDLFKIPTMRISMAQHISQLYGVGLTLKDILSWSNDVKKLCKSDDPERYEKIYALMLEQEKLAEFTADPVKQGLALCTVYIMSDKEDINFFDESASAEKLKYWATVPKLVAFFLSWHNGHIRAYTKTLNKISQTVLKVEKAGGRIQPGNT